MPFDNDEYYKRRLAVYNHTFHILISPRKGGPYGYTLIEETIYQHLGQDKYIPHKLLKVYRKHS